MSEKSKILIVDDNSENIRVLLEILKRDYRLNAATDGQKAIDIARKWDPDLILLDVVMPGMNGYDVCISLRTCEKTKHIPVIFISAVADIQEEISCIKIGALDYMKKPINPELLKEKIKNYLPLKKERNILNSVLKHKISENSTADADLFYRAMSMLEFRDSSIGKNHVRRCVSYAQIMLTGLISNPQYKQLSVSGVPEMIIAAVPYHDIGKVLLPDELLLKKGKLTGEQFEHMKIHVKDGCNLIADAFAEGEQKQVIEDIIRRHHERWDGTGYPDRLSGDSIPLCAQIMAIVDQYDALTTRRIYRMPSRHFEAVRIISAESGKGFSPGLVYEFLKSQDEFLEVVKRYADDSEDESALTAAIESL